MISTVEDNNDNNDQHGGGGKDLVSSKEECTSCEQNNVNNITEEFSSMALMNMSTCASCGKEGNNEDMNTCNKCKMVKYCNAACKKKHRSKHKKKCERRVAELHDEQLFKEVEPEECPICMLPLPHDNKTSTFKTCCGKLICDGCMYAMALSEGKDLCAFCRTPPPSSDEEDIKRLKNLMGNGNGNAFYQLGMYYGRGINLPQDVPKANALFLKAGELGCAAGYYNLGISYDNGYGVEVDKKKAIYYWELAAMLGDLDARHNLGCGEYRTDNHRRAMKHFMIAAKVGFKSLDAVKKGFMYGFVTKDEYESTLRCYHERQKEMKCDMRERAAAAKAQS